MFLAFEIMEEASLRQPGGLADLVHRSGRVALGQHQLLGGVEQLLFGQRIALDYIHGAYLPVGMRLSRASSGVKTVFRESAAECCESRSPAAALSVRLAGVRRPPLAHIFDERPASARVEAASGRLTRSAVGDPGASL